jgi:integrase
VADAVRHDRHAHDDRAAQHGLRHTFASLYLTEAPSPDVYYLSRMLGHASIQETVDTYGRWLPANRKGALDVLDDAPLATNLQPNRS